MLTPFLADQPSWARRVEASRSRTSPDSLQGADRGAFLRTPFDRQ